MKYWYLLCIVVFVLLYAALPRSVTAQEALLYLSPPSAIVTIGDTFSVDVMLDTGGAPINTAEGSVTFREQDITVVSLDLQNSIISSWVQQPSYEPGTGRITFAGSLPAGRPFSGSDGVLFRVTFTALRNTSSQVWFSQGAAVHAADGRASNILSQLRSGTYTMTSREVVPALAQVSSATSLGSAPNLIRSPTHADGRLWYATTTAVLLWDLPEGTEEVRTALTNSPDTNPAKSYEPPIGSVTIPDLSEGTSFFHLKFRTGAVWSDTYRMALNVDVTSPIINAIAVVPRDDTTDPTITLAVSSYDALSGISHLTASVNGDVPRRFQGDIDSLALTVGFPGTHTIEVVAFDRAGNSAATTTSVTVDALEAPEITDAPTLGIVGNPVVLKGISSPNMEILLRIRHNDGEVIEKRVLTDAAGVFAATIADPARAGEYETIIVATNKRGASSEPSSPIRTRVEEPKILLFGSTAVSYLSVIVAAVGLLVLLVALLWVGWYLFSHMRGRIRGETDEALEVVHTSLGELKEDVAKHMEQLLAVSAHRTLTREEQQMLEDLSRHFVEAEKDIVEEIKDIRNTARLAPRAIKVARRRS